MTDETVRNPRNAALHALRTLRSANHQGFRPRDLPNDKLKGLNHAEWLEDFSKILGLQTGVPMTAKREGTITRLHWASLYVKLLEQQVRNQEVETKKLRAKLQADDQVWAIVQDWPEFGGGNHDEPGTVG